MKTLKYIALSALASSPAFAEGTRHVDAHEHGVGQLNIAFDGNQIAMELHASGADIVGFEYAPKTGSDQAALDNAVATLARPLELFVFPDAAKCSVVQASAELESEEEHDAHDHEEHEEHADEHGEEEHDDHAHEHDDHAHEHGDDEHDDHTHEHGEEEHDGHDDEHTEEVSAHTEFHAEYLLECADPSAASMITFAYFETFQNSIEVDVQVLTASGANAFEVERDSPTLDLRDLF